jgi:hypothetical protein
MCSVFDSPKQRWKPFTRALLEQRQVKQNPPINPTVTAERLYNDIVKKATADLMGFLDTIYTRALSVTYFDEAHKLGLCFWVLLRLLYNQESSIRLWYVFMGTKLSLSYYAPRLSNRQPPPFIPLNAHG